MFNFFYDWVTKAPLYHNCCWSFTFATVGALTVNDVFSMKLNCRQSHMHTCTRTGARTLTWTHTSAPKEVCVCGTSFLSRRFVFHLATNVFFLLFFCRPPTWPLALCQCANKNELHTGLSRNTHTHRCTHCPTHLLLCISWLPMAFIP